ncbi:hypothetical protein TNCV_2196201 [Trichonephila clavipes]|nr:hypothetical protein TNCV_2196201 [Trichonephila clavipes]
MNFAEQNAPTQLWYTAKRVLAYLYSAGVPGLIRRPLRTLEAVTCVVFLPQGDLKQQHMSRLKHSPVGGVWKLGKGAPAQVSSSSLDHGSK